jgi:hypothetical protein
MRTGRPGGFAKITVILGVEGHALYVNDTRVAGPKPWAGGKVVIEWRALKRDIRAALVGRMP